VGLHALGWVGFEKAVVINNAGIILVNFLLQLGHLFIFVTRIDFRIVNKYDKDRKRHVSLLKI